VATPLLDSQVFAGLIGTVARGFTWKQRGDARLASSFAVSWLGDGGAEPQEGGGLARAWTTCGPKMLRHQRPDEAPGGVEGTVATEQQFCYVLLLLLT